MDEGFLEVAYAVSWAGQSPVEESGGSWRIRWRRVACSMPPKFDQARTQPASASGRWKVKTWRLAGSGSKLLVKRVSTPVDSWANASGLVSAGTVSGRPVVYFADCHSTPVSGVPFFLASITPTALRSMKSR